MVHVLLALSIAFVSADAAQLAPGDGLGLGSNPVARSPAKGAPRPGIPIPIIPGAGAGGAAALVAAMAPTIARGVRRRRFRARDTDPFYIYVPGHGGNAAGFDDLATRMDLDPERIRVFDYRWAHSDPSPENASRWAPTARAADILGFYVREQAKLHSQIYLVGHSKGGAVITELVSRWDADPTRTVPAVTGAAILDPPIASGPLGALQSAGWFVGGAPDDGLFDPVRCDLRGCRDVREHLGVGAEVEVIAVRNPSADVTNFRDEPEGLRVYDLIDGKAGALSLWWDPRQMLGRAGEAHESVLHSDAVADCIRAESTQPGSCRWDGDVAPSDAEAGS